MMKLKEISWILITMLVTLPSPVNLTLAPPEFANLIRIFQPCLIVLFDYTGTNWIISSSIPITRFKLKVAYAKLYTKIDSSDKMLSAYVDVHPNWTVAVNPIPRTVCAVEFHLYPPIQFGTLENFLTITDDLRIAHQKTNVGPERGEYAKLSFKTSENSYYRILVTDIFDSIKWTAWASSLIYVKKASYIDPSLLCVLALSDFEREASLKRNDVAQLYFICELCVKCHLQYVRFSSTFHSLVEWNSYISSLTRSVVNANWKLSHRVIDADDVEEKYAQISAAIKTPNFKYLYFREHHSDMPLDMILFKVAFPNATVTGLGDDCTTMPQIEDSSDDVKHEKFFMANSHSRIAWEVSTIPTVIMDAFSVYLLPYKIQGLEFTTCHQKERNSGGISSPSLTTPLDGFTWLFILITGILVTVSLSIGYFILGWGNNFTENMLYLAYGGLLEQSNSWAQLSSYFEFEAQNSARLYQVAGYPEKNASHRGALFARIICSCWILCCLVVSNSYKGEYVKRQTVPRAVPRYSRFQELLENKFIIYTIPIDTSFYLTVVNTTSNPEEIDAINSVFSLLSIFPNVTDGNETPSLINRIRNVARVPENYSEIIFGRDSLIRLVSNCSRKIALVSWSDHVELVRANLEAINPEYAVSKSAQPLEKMAKGWAVLNWGDATVLSRISGMMSSGLAQKWYRVTKEKEISQFIKKSESLKNRWEQLKMGGNLRETFALFCLVCVIAIGSFGLEFIIEFHSIVTVKMTSLKHSDPKMGYLHLFCTKRCLVLFFVYIPLVLVLIYLVRSDYKDPVKELLDDFAVASGNLRLAQDDANILGYIRQKFLQPPATEGKVVLSGKDVHFKHTFEQQEMYRFIYKILGNKNNGFFLECGAHDGEFYSNTLPLEMRHGWTGLLVEADPYPLLALRKRNRRSWISSACLSPHTFPIKVQS
ncbi:hypothetical protein Fcan01_20599 [Folsomia candida]|uniref:Uncharacterized protein n=1 Tax=Folsomia candida TaxID=158441 RepID=A0A226DKJ0_FOLCA|nr:hypothetical protein Fcan01_20599 [Folsomia candida]